MQIILICICFGNLFLAVFDTPGLFALYPQAVQSPSFSSETGQKYPFLYKRPIKLF